MRCSNFLSTVWLLALANAAPGALESRQEENKWVVTWTSMPQLVEQNNLPPSPYLSGSGVFNDATLRQTLHMSIAAPRIRVQISNTFGGSDLPITAASIGLPTNGAAGVSGIQASPLMGLTFGGSASTTIPRGQVKYSDPIDFPITAQSMITVSLYLQRGQSGTSITGHPGSRTTSWMSAGNKANSTTLSGGSTVHWYFLSAVEAWVPRNHTALVILGDSITDGRGSDDNKNNRWPDLLLARMQKNGLTTIGVNNQAAGGNRVLQDGLGPSLISRYKRDAITQAGVKCVMVFEGVNDIGTAGSDSGTQTRTADQVIAAFKQIAADSKAAGLATFAATITALGSSYSGGSRESARQKVNNWILTSGTFDTVVDFDKILRNPSNPSQLAQQYNGGDGLHPNVAGYQAVADQFPLDALTKFCTAPA